MVRRVPSRSKAAEPASPGSESEPRALLASCGFLLARLGSEARRQFTRLLERHGLSMHHFALLLALAERDGLPQQAVSTLAGVDPRNAVPLVDELEERGLVVRGVDPSDRRRHKLALTRDGSHKIGALRAAGAAVEEDMLKALSANERERLHALLVKLFTALEGVGSG